MKKFSPRWRRTRNRLGGSSRSSRSGKGKSPTIGIGIGIGIQRRTPKKIISKFRTPVKGKSFGLRKSGVLITGSFSAAKKKEFRGCRSSRRKVRGNSGSASKVGKGTGVESPKNLFFKKANERTLRNSFEISKSQGIVSVEDGAGDDEDSYLLVSEKSDTFSLNTKDEKKSLLNWRKLNSQVVLVLDAPEIVTQDDFMSFADWSPDVFIPSSNRKKRKISDHLNEFDDLFDAIFLKNKKKKEEKKKDQIKESVGKVRSFVSIVLYDKLYIYDHLEKTNFEVDDDLDENRTLVDFKEEESFRKRKSKLLDSELLALLSQAEYYTATKFSSSIRTNTDNDFQTTYLAVGTSHGKIKVFDVCKNVKIREINSCRRVNCLDWNPTVGGGASMLSAGTMMGHILNFDLRMKKERLRKFDFCLGHSDGVRRLRWNRTGKYLLSGGADRVVNVWDSRNINSKLSYWAFDGHSSIVNGIDWCSWNDDIFASGGGRKCKRIFLHNIVNGETFSETKTKAPITELLFSKKTKELITAHGSPCNSFCIWGVPNSNDNSSNLNLLHNNSQHNSILHVSNLDINDPEFLLQNSYQGEGKLSKGIGSLLKKSYEYSRVHFDEVMGIVLSRSDGNLLLSVGADERMKFWTPFPKHLSVHNLGKKKETNPFDKMMRIR